MIKPREELSPPMGRQVLCGTEIKPWVKFVDHVAVPECGLLFDCSGRASVIILTNLFYGAGASRSDGMHADLVGIVAR